MTESKKLKVLAANRKAHFEYSFTDKFEAGLVLKGTEIKSLRAGGCQLKDAYIALRKNECYLQKAYISPYKGTHVENNHQPERLRKLLLNSHEVNKIQGALQKKGLTCIPLRIYLKKGRAKLEIAIAKGKKKWDKREDHKKKSQKRDIQRHLKRSSGR